MVITTLFWTTVLVYGGILCGIFDGLIPLFNQPRVLMDWRGFVAYLEILVVSNSMVPLMLWTLLVARFALSKRWKVVTSYCLSMGVIRLLEYAHWSAEQRYAFTCDWSGYPLTAYRVNVRRCGVFDLITATTTENMVETCCGYAMRINHGLIYEVIMSTCSELVTLWFVMKFVGWVWWFVVWVSCPNLTTKQSKWGEFKDWVEKVSVMCWRWLDSFFGGFVEEDLDKVHCDRTGKVAITMATPRSTTTNEIKVVLSTENNTGVTRAILESAVPGNPLRNLGPGAGSDVNRLAKSQVLLTNSGGVVAGMATYVKTLDGTKLITLAHVIKSCTLENDQVLAVSPLTGKGMLLTPLNPDRLTTFRVGDHVDVRVVLNVPANFGARLSLTAAPMKESFRPGHGVVFSPPSTSDGLLRYCPGRVDKYGKSGLLTFAGSTTPGTSGAGVFVGGEMVSVHVGALQGMEKNLSFFNIPRGGPIANAALRGSWLSSQRVSLESAPPETKAWVLAQDLEAEAAIQAYHFDDIDYRDDLITVTRYDAIEEEYAKKRVRVLEKTEENYTATLDIINLDRPSWDDDDYDDQNVLQDMHEEPNKEKASRMGKRGILKQGSVMPRVRLESVHFDEPTEEQAEIDFQIGEVERKLALKVVEDEKQRRLAESRRKLAELKSLLYSSPVKLETAIGADQPVQDFGLGERPPLKTTASQPTTSLRTSGISESPSVEATTDSRNGSTSVLLPSPPTQSKRKKKKGKGRSSESGEPVIALEAATPPSNQGPTSTLVSLTKQLEDMTRLIEGLKQQRDH